LTLNRTGTAGGQRVGSAGTSCSWVLDVGGDNLNRTQGEWKSTTGDVSFAASSAAAPKSRPSWRPIATADGLAMVMPSHAWTELLHRQLFPMAGRGDPLKFFHSGVGDSSLK
jgi:hypothetical protein